MDVRLTRKVIFWEKVMNCEFFFHVWLFFSAFLTLQFLGELREWLYFVV